jgi:hypothetical protein
MYSTNHDFSMIYKLDRLSVRHIRWVRDKLKERELTARVQMSKGHLIIIRSAELQGWQDFVTLDKSEFIYQENLRPPGYRRVKHSPDKKSHMNPGSQTMLRIG